MVYISIGQVSTISRSRNWYKLYYTVKLEKEHIINDENLAWLKLGENCINLVA